MLANFDIARALLMGNRAENAPLLKEVTQKSTGETLAA